MNNNKPSVIGIGELLWDMFSTGKKIGGAPVNLAFHASKSGANGFAISAVGDDAYGEEIVEQLALRGIEGVIERINYPTGKVLVELSDGIPDYTITENVAWDFIPLTNKMREMVISADAVCFGTLAQRNETSRSTIQSLVNLTSPDCYRIFDINIRQSFYSKELIDKSLRLCNVLKINDNELKLLKSLYNLEFMYDIDACYLFLEMFSLKYIILTAGADFSVVISSDKHSYIKTPKVKVVDTVGAGDSFTGTFITSILKGFDLEESHQKSVNRSAYVCSQEGAWVD